MAGIILDHTTGKVKFIFFTLFEEEVKILWYNKTFQQIGDLIFRIISLTFMKSSMRYMGVGMNL